MRISCQRDGLLRRIHMVFELGGKLCFHRHRLQVPWVILCVSRSLLYVLVGLFCMFRLQVPSVILCCEYYYVETQFATTTTTTTTTTDDDDNNNNYY